MKRNTEELKEKLISFGIEEIRTNGIDRMSMRTIAQKCGVTHGAPYKHFGSKDRYIQVVMEHLSMFFLKNMIQGIDTSIDARTQLTLMGCNFVRFAQEETYLFEALFIKFPYNYMELSQETISVNSSLPGFEHEENLSSGDAEILIHFWSFIAGLALLVRSPVGESFKENDVQKTVRTMLDIYIKGDS